jgi:predicted SAM-dependent methyltransferase
VSTTLDITRTWPCGPWRIDRVYGSHVIEHLPLADGRRFLTHACVALKPGGRIRLATPDARGSAEAYLRGERPVLRNGRVQYPVDILRHAFAEHEHWLGYIYDEDVLRVELETAGFRDVVRCRAGNSDDPAFIGVEPRTTGFDGQVQLVLEGTRP